MVDETGAKNVRVKNVEETPYDIASGMVSFEYDLRYLLLLVHAQKNEKGTKRNCTEKNMRERIAFLPTRLRFLEE